VGWSVRPGPVPWNDGPVDAAVWKKAGLLTPDEAGSAERIALLEYLTSRGATLEQMVEAHRLGGLPAVAGDLVVGSGRSSLSVEEIAVGAGVTEDRVRRVLLAAGLPATSDSTLPADLVDVVAAFEQGAALMGDDAILAFTRVLGAAASTVAEAAVALFYAEMGPGTAREGTDELARARVAETATRAFTNVPEVLCRLLLAQFERAGRRPQLARAWPSPGGVGAQEGASEAAAIAVGGPSGTIALGFVDLVGSTAWAEGLSLRDQSLALSGFESTAWSSAVLAGGRVVKMIGDAVFFVAPSVDAACRIALEVCGAVALDPRLPPARGAVGYGLVVPREGDYFGPLVNLVARLVKVAEPGVVVVTAEAASALPADGGWTMSEVASHALRGVEHPVTVYAVDRPPRD
jgi:class 3 adenylate cyclase